MANQKGAALIVVLSLLVGSLVIGLSSMQSSQVDERLAGSQKLVSEVQMAAEKAASVGLERASDVGLLMPLMRGRCLITDFFININDDPYATPSDRDGLRWSGINGWAPGWIALLDAAVENDKPCVDYNSSWVDSSNQYQAEDFPSGYFSDFYGDMLADASGGLCSAPLECAYRLISVGNSRYVVGLARYVQGGQVLAESRPVFVELDIDDPPPEVEWIFNTSPISLLTLISNLKISGANNVTLDGGNGSDILAHPGNIDDLVADFTVTTGNKTFTPQVDPVDHNVFGVDELMRVVQSLYEISEESDFIDFRVGDAQMKDVAITSGIVVVGGNLTWNGKNDFEGVVVVLGPEVHYQGAGNGDLYGSLIHAPITVTENAYEWVETGQYVDFSQVEKFDDEGAWRFLSSGDEAETDFDFSGGGGSTIRSDNNAMMDARDEYWGAVSNADFITWESD